MVHILKINFIFFLAKIVSLGMHVVSEQDQNNFLYVSIKEQTVIRYILREHFLVSTCGHFSKKSVICEIVCVT